ncbi:MAG: Crp/Fnr family transcriptional regulator [Chloroflexi bacterium]|nr:Crp/Fnr family transcriptional regulator [Chloroflexota bacterium]MCY3695850.1 Crp/Fnr family transcriptional regulator [Chloroflexota bacterium]MXX31257.1 Crp/Fnr family transcriptional regulator [Chloroflexota bacterium]MXX80859.1 Crp/Fnr family transcriptional regulator [Chloroflexota bacterium]MYD17452.1 Crp/Fnr family transcriptional regulator [Chloroflexota bacterium]
MTTRRSSASDRTDEASDLLRNVVLFRGMPPQMLEELGRRLRPDRYRAHSDIFHEGDEGSTLYIILSGAVKIYIPSLDGREVVLAVHRKYDLLGEMSLLDDDPRSASATTIEDTEVVKLSRHDFLSVLDRHPEAQRAIIDVLVARLRATNQSIQDAYLLDVPGRLARRLLAIANEHGEPTEDGVDIGLRVSQQELANMIGASRVAVNKQLQQWRKQRIVDVNRQRVTIVNRSALEREYSLSP